MANGTIYTRLRPIKIAFLVHPEDREGLLQAIEINTFLWGGQYNPIIPAFKKRPKVWWYKSRDGISARKIIAGYLDNYDPDFVIPVGECRNMSFEVGNRQKIEINEILSELDKEQSPKFGIGIFEILNHFISKELKFVRRQPVDIFFPSFGEKYKPYMASLFGILPKNIESIIRKRFDEALGTRRNNCTISDYDRILNSKALFLRRISSLYLKPTQIYSRNDGCLFFLDAGKILDVIDYWNLRALGWYVFPIPKQMIDRDRIKNFMVNFIEQQYYPINPNLYNHTTILKSRYTTEIELKDFVKSLEISKPKDNKQFKYAFQYWYPRIWDEWAKDHDHALCCQLDGGSLEHDITSDEEYLSLKTVDPKFAKPFAKHNEPRFANEIRFRFYSNESDITAQVIPEGDEHLAASVGIVGFNEWRFSRNEIVYLSRYTDSNMFFSLPKAEEMFSGWLKLKGWEVDISASGRIAKQMLYNSVVYGEFQD